MIKRLTSLILRRGGILGAFAYAGANFIITFLVQARAPSHEFGVFAFALVLILFGQSLSNALFSSPLVVALSHVEEDDRITIKSFFVANLGYCVAATALLVGISAYMGASTLTLALIGIQGFAIWMRWFFRAVDLAKRDFNQPILADIAYSVVTSAVGLSLIFLNGPSVNDALFGMAAGAVVSCIFVGRATLRAIATASFDRFRRYAGAFAEHGRWALLGVVTTEITANLHSYAIAVFMGPAAFAPVAALTLFFRPIPILVQAVNQYERPLFAKYLKAGAVGQVHAAVSKIRYGILAAVAANSALVAVLMLVFPQIIGGGRYDPSLLWPMWALVFATQIARSINTGSSTALQAGGLYRRLSTVTLITAPLTLIATFGAIAIAPSSVLLVLIAVLAGECLRAALVTKTYAIAIPQLDTAKRNGVDPMNVPVRALSGTGGIPASASNKSIED